MSQRAASSFIVFQGRLHSFLNLWSIEAKMNIQSKLQLLKQGQTDHFNRKMLSSTQILRKDRL